MFLAALVFKCALTFNPFGIMSECLHCKLKYRWLLCRPYDLESFSASLTFSRTECPYLLLSSLYLKLGLGISLCKGY